MFFIEKQISLVFGKDQRIGRRQSNTSIVSSRLFRSTEPTIQPWETGWRASFGRALNEYMTKHLLWPEEMWASPIR